MPNPRKANLPYVRNRNVKQQDKRIRSDARPSNGKQLSRPRNTGQPVTKPEHTINKNTNKDLKTSKSIDASNKRSSNLPTPHYMKIKSRKKSTETRLTGSKKEITVVTINANGRGALGLTPRYKLDLIKSYLLSSKPDTIFFQVINIE